MPSTTPSHAGTGPKIKVGEVHSLRVEDLAPNGRGLAYLSGQPIFVKEAVPGDVVQVQLVRVRPNQTEAKILKIETASPNRISPRCQHFGPCGGCDLQQVAYPAQVEWKLKALKEVLQREGGFKALPPIQVWPMKDPWAYRSKMEFSFGQEADRVTLGLHQRGSFHRIVDIATCHIAPPAVSELLTAIKQVANRFSLQSYNPKFHQGFWRYAVIRSSGHRQELLLLLVTNEGPREPIDALLTELPAAVPALKSFYWGISTKVSDVAQPERMALVFGSETLEDAIGQIRFQMRPTNFVQPNRLLVPTIYEAIQNAVALTGREVVYDLYCGIGLIALSLAGQAKAVYGVESEEENVTSAQRNADLNGITNATFLCGKVEDLLRGRALFKAGPKPDVIVVDPPRVGLHKEVYAPLLEAQSPAVVYLSCNPLSMAKDLKILLERDPRYQLTDMQMFDFFPHTTHVEVLATLRRQS